MPLAAFLKKSFGIDYFGSVGYRTGGGLCHEPERWLQIDYLY